MDWIGFTAAFLVFLVSHAVPVRAPVKPWLVAQLGQRGFMLAYSLLSLGVLAWLIVAAARAPVVLLWEWAPWQNMLVILAMLCACLAVALSLGRPNPFSFGGPDEGFDPGAPGLVRWTRHPLLWALALWAAAHGVANGTLAHAVMFFGFSGFAGLGMVMIDRRRRARMGRDWGRLLSDVKDQKGPIIDPDRDLARFALGVAAWAGLMAAHGAIIGVAPWP